MERQQFETIMLNYKKGTYIHMVWETVGKAGDVKLSDGIVRFTNIEVKTSKAGYDYVTARITKNKRVKPKVTYYNADGVIISKEEYEANNVICKIDDYFAKRLENIISLR